MHSLATSVICYVMLTYRSMDAWLGTVVTMVKQERNDYDSTVKWNSEVASWHIANHPVCKKLPCLLTNDFRSWGV